MAKKEVSFLSKLIANAFFLMDKALDYLPHTAESLGQAIVTSIGPAESKPNKEYVTCTRKGSKSYIIAEAPIDKYSIGDKVEVIRLSNTSRARNENPLDRFYVRPWFANLAGKNFYGERDTAYLIKHTLDLDEVAKGQES